MINSTYLAEPMATLDRSAPPTGTTQAAKRLMREHKQMHDHPDEDFVCHWDELNNNILTWHFCFKGATNTVYEGGIYMGMLIYPSSYPFKPPEVRMITPNGRMKLNSALCLSVSSFHPESWSPGWTMRSVIMGLVSFISDETNPHTLGAIVETDETRRRLARESHAWNAKNRVYQAYFSDFGKPKELAAAVQPETKLDEPPAKKARIDVVVLDP